MKRTATNDSTGKYVLATGEAATNRLRVLHDVYGPGARRVLMQAGLRPGMRVADLGCGVGMTTALLAKLVGPTGQVVGVDASGDQLAQARARLAPHFPNVGFVEASALNTGLPHETFDLVYCRFLLIHLTEPARALQEMHDLLKPNGIVVCEDGDLTSAGSQPPSALDAFADLFGRLGPMRGVDYTLGRALFRMVLAANFTEPGISFNQPAVARGEGKRLLEWTLAEARDAVVATGLVTSSELDHILNDMQQAAEDETVVALMPRMSQVWARRRQSSASIAA